MADAKVYVVMGDAGDWSDQSGWCVSVHATRGAAMARAAAVKAEWTRVMKAHSEATRAWRLKVPARPWFTPEEYAADKAARGPYPEREVNALDPRGCDGRFTVHEMALDDADNPCAEDRDGESAIRDLTERGYESARLRALALWLLAASQELRKRRDGDG